LVYFFGSKSKGEGGPLSDYDFAVYFDEALSKKEMVRKKIEIIADLSEILQTDEIDLAVLNLIESPEFNYNVITSGKLIHHREPYKLDFETNVLSKYFDFLNHLRKHNLTAS